MIALSPFLPLWSLIIPALSFFVFLAALSGFLSSGFWALIAATMLVSAVLAAVHHAEVIAKRVGEPFGTLILALAVTAIESGLIMILMTSGGEGSRTLARDTVFATVMIVSNGVVGICLLIGGLRHREQDFQAQGTRSLLAVLAALTTLILVLPNFTTSTPGPTYTHSQLIFAGAASLLLYGVFAFVQTVRHRDLFLPIATELEPNLTEIPASGDNRIMAVCSILLVISLVSVVGLAKIFSSFIEATVLILDIPQTVVGIVIAMLVLLPETLTAIRAARINQLQTSLNLALGSGIATIGLTIPVIAVLSIVLDIPLWLGIDDKSLVLLGLTFIVGTLTLGTGRTTVLQGAVHLIIFMAYLFLAVVP